MTLAEAYIAGWNSVMGGADPRYVNISTLTDDQKYAWKHGALDAMEAEDGEEPEPAAHDYR